MLELDHVTYSWPDSDGEAVLADLSLTITAGDKVVLLGANGCGKSTLLKLMNGLLFPQTGQVRWRDHPLTPAGMKERAFAREFRRRCVLLFQHPEAMLFNPTVRDEIAYGPRQLGLADIDARVGHWAEELKLTNCLDKPPYALSGGEKQKLALACLLALDPDLLLLDEPGASLDPATVGWLVDTLLHSDRTLVVSTHNLSLAAELGSRCIVLGGRGEILFDGPMKMALTGMTLLEKAGLAHRHKHRHGGAEHVHVHGHDWEPGT
jgi:cobalt/nickel transport system ATP-binding protein